MLEDDAVVRTTASDTPQFHPTHRILWTRGVSCRCAPASPTARSWSSRAATARAIAPSNPSAPRADLVTCCVSSSRPTADTGFSRKQREQAAQAYVADRRARRAVPARSGCGRDAARRPSSVSVELRAGGERLTLPLIADGTRGFMQSGVLLLDVARYPVRRPSHAGIPRAARLRAPPRILRIEPGGVAHRAGWQPATPRRTQRHGHARPAHQARDAGPAFRRRRSRRQGPDQGVGRDPRVARVDDLGRSGPDDLDYLLDADGGAIVLGNGLNGHLPRGRQRRSSSTIRTATAAPAIRRAASAGRCWASATSSASIPIRWPAAATRTRTSTCGASRASRSPAYTRWSRRRI